MGFLRPLWSSPAQLKPRSSPREPSWPTGPSPPHPSRAPRRPCAHFSLAEGWGCISVISTSRVTSRRPGGREGTSYLAFAPPRARHKTCGTVCSTGQSLTNADTRPGCVPLPEKSPGVHKTRACLRHTASLRSPSNMPQQLDTGHKLHGEALSDISLGFHEEGEGRAKILYNAVGNITRLRAQVRIYFY